MRRTALALAAVFAISAIALPAQTTSAPKVKKHKAQKVKGHKAQKVKKHKAAPHGTA